MHRAALQARLRDHSAFVSCAILSVLIGCVSSSAVRADDWPHWLGPKRDGVWREKGIVKELPAGGPKVLWRAPLGSGYAGPAVAAGRVYITDRVLAEGSQNPKSGFTVNRLNGKERVLCLDEKTGKTLWKHEYACTYEISYSSGPRTTPVVEGNRLWTLGAMGDLLCLEADTGKVVWSKNFPRDYEANPPQWGFSAHPLLDGDRLICVVGGRGSVAVAFDKQTGKELWRALSAKEPGYCPPMIFAAGGKQQLIIWHPEAVNSLDPETGKVWWSEKFILRAGLAIPTPRQAGDLLFVTAFYNGPLMLKLAADKPAASVLWKGKSNSERQTDGLHSIMVTPFIRDGHIYGVCSYGQLRCLKAQTGERVWEDLRATGGKEERWGNAFLVAHEDRYFLFNEKGDLIIAELSPMGYKEISRANILKPDNFMAGRPVIWSHPAFANRNAYARNDQEIICVSLASGLE